MHGSRYRGGFQHTTELMVKKYNQVMCGTQPKEWAKEVIKEHWRMVTNKVWKPILRTKDMKTITTTWAMKQKASGDKQARVNARGFEQIPGVHYDPNDKASPVVNMTTIRIILTLWASCSM